MNARTVIIAGSFAQVALLIVGTYVAVVATSYAIGGLCCCVASEWEG